METEIMYELNSLVIVSILFVAILSAYEICYRIGSYRQAKSDTEIKTQTNSIQAGILGLLALLLGFTFNMSLQRFDNRSHAVIKEANAIGTAIMRTKLLPAPHDSVTRQLLYNYVDVRLDAGRADLTAGRERALQKIEAENIQNQLWESAVKAARSDPNPVTTGSFANALNQVIDAHSERNAILQRHVPEPILFLLFAVFIVSGGLMGYSSGLGQKRVYIPTVIFTFLITLVVFIIIDLDRPDRGLINIRQDSLLDLKRN